MYIRMPVAPKILIEFAPYGNLRDFLVKRRPGAVRDVEELPLPHLRASHLIDFGQQVANGMDYISRQHRRTRIDAFQFVHRDLAARNVLVGSNFEAKIADFGLARKARDCFCDQNEGPMPVRWMAPESISHRCYTRKSDVWSFGVLLWEIFTFGGFPYPAFTEDSLLRAIQAGIRNRQPRACPASVYELMLSCWFLDPLHRPTFKQIIDFLSQSYDRAIRFSSDNELVPEPRDEGATSESVEYHEDSGTIDLSKYCYVDQGTYI
ncbi:unnamed protein product [Mesocestoides corti]|uniref:Protein kinase domain-containing protein n=2 Tax=Mesocestoides corti TaxID=53468 RepID=A0A0R3UMW2_MESCO|nr:unnamed protein product [Mesocestoides corti]